MRVIAIVGITLLLFGPLQYLMAGGKAVGYGLITTLFIVLVAGRLGGIEKPLFRDSWPAH